MHHIVEKLVHWRYNMSSMLSLPGFKPEKSTPECLRNVIIDYNSTLSFAFWQGVLIISSWYITLPLKYDLNLPLCENITPFIPCLLSCPFSIYLPALQHFNNDDGTTFKRPFLFSFHDLLYLFRAPCDQLSRWVVCACVWRVFQVENSRK